MATSVPFASSERKMTMITYAMIAALAILVFLCVASSLSSYSGRRPL